MKKYTQFILASLVAIVGLAFTPLVTQTAGALDPFSRACDTGTSGAGSQTPGAGAPEAPAEDGEGGGSSTSICGASQQDSIEKIIQNVINVILIILGMISVIMIIIGGIRYTTSNGDANSIKGAKDTILYSVVGLIVAILSFAIVNFVLGAFGGGGEAS